MKPGAIPAHIDVSVDLTEASSAIESRVRISIGRGGGRRG